MMQLWPPYFQPAPPSDAEAAVGERIPVNLLDLFAVRSSPQSRPEPVAVLGCLGGGVLPVRVADAAALPHALRSQLTTAAVQLRGQFRVLTAQELWVASVDAVDQVVEATGLNDPAYLYGRLQGVIRAGSGQITITASDQPGSATVGRLDLLHACARAYTTRFPLAESGGCVYQLLLPLGSVHATRQGCALALCYPTLDPALFASPDNGTVLLRITYELLARLQQDIREEQTGHPFATALLPVPSRQRLESDLVADGYRVQGDTATRAAQAGGQADASSFLAQLRALAQSWFAPQLRLPEQATPATYQTIICGLLPSLFTPADQAMAGALDQIVTFDADTAPQAPLADSPATSSAGAVTRPLGARTVAAQPEPKNTPQRQPAELRTDRWAEDFTSMRPIQRLLTARLDRAEWARDALAERGASTTNTPRTTQESSNWANDFASTPAPADTPKPLDNDWSDDFA
jgi:hypothetical protein